MKTRTKVLGLMMAAVLLVSATIFGTMAYLTDKDTVTNTFTVGNVAITLDEAPVDANGKETTGNRTTENKYKLLPGHEYDKDPTVWVDKDSESCWLFVKVENNIVDIEDSENNIATQIKTNGWFELPGVANVYYKEYTKGTTDMKQPVFNTFKIAGTVDNDTLTEYEGETIVVTAYAVQRDGFDNAKAAWDAAQFN